MRQSDIAMSFGKLIPTILLSVVLMLSAFKETNSSVSSIDSARRSEPKTWAQEPKPIDITELKQGQPIDRELTAGSTHTFRIALSPLQYLHIEVEQLGINVEVSLSGPKGEQLASLDWWWRERSESLWALAESGGDYALKISAPRQPAETGKYRVKIEKIGDWQPDSTA